jgi:small-conductance mechanosensitive channel
VTSFSPASATSKSSISSKKGKVKAADVMLILEQEKAMLTQELATVKKNSEAAISDLRDQVSALSDQVTELRAILRSVMAKQAQVSPTKKPLLDDYTAEFVSSAEDTDGDMEEDSSDSD